MSSSVVDPDSPPTLFSSFSFSNNLVEVSALTALVGSSVAESMVLGNRGSGGIAWAATSSFGTISVVKACCSAACSGWLRETLGIRSVSCDVAVGLYLPHDSARAEKIRRNTGEPMAIFCYQSETGARVKDEKSRGPQVPWSDVYALDHSTAMMLRGIPDTPVGGSLEIYTYGDYPFFRTRDQVFHTIAILLSSAKLAEVYVLWTHGAGILGIISATPWLFFCAGAILVELREAILRRRPEPALGTVDVIAGHLPMISRRGGGRKIILGTAENARNGLRWRVFWFIGAGVSAVSILFSYIILGQRDPPLVLIWAGFQLLWLGVRIMVYHIADPTDPMALRILVGRPWSNVPRDLKERVFELICALAQCQAFVHPRGRRQYNEDTVSARQLVSILDGVELNTICPLPPIHIPLIPLDFTAVFGDTLLSSVMWVAGSKLTPMDLYDSCIVVLSLPKLGPNSVAGGSIAVPAVRVLSGSSHIPADSEYGPAASFVPKGAPNIGYGLSWWYWVPCGAGLWLQIRRPTENQILGRCEGEIRTDAQVSELLGSGKLNIGFTAVEDLKAVLELSRTAADTVSDLFG
ncbi:hypothetical protein C8R47DRAFT_134102 [Mycena vitilis]|nr:hypothetical protein C8R47DRAFT_134102 [Mycena vitilis]